MGEYLVQELVDVPRLTAGRRLVAVERMSEVAITMPLWPVLQPRLQAALQAQREVLALEDARRNADDTSMHADGAKDLDAQVDRAVAALHTTLDGMIKAFPPQEAALAKTVMEEAFGSGVLPITGLPYIDEHAALRALTEKLRQGALGAAIQTLQLERWVSRIEELNAAYGALLTRPERVPYDKVREADTAGWEALLAVVAVVLGAYPTNAAADVQARQALLQPIVDQQKEMALLRARRRHGGLLEIESPSSEPTPEVEPEPPQEGPPVTV